MIGKTVAHYEIVEQIGTGGMGDVYRARDTKLGRDVALKFLPEDVRTDPERLARFQQEARAVAALSHPNIVAIHELGTDDGSSYVVMELLEGEVLNDCLEEGPIPPRKTMELAGQIADGLAAAHDRGIIHRDIKPANIFITNNGRAKILDFGLARREDAERDPAALRSAATRAGETLPGTVLGTVGYMSPEQVRGGKSDARSDIFSFGVVLHEMLSGAKAFQGDSAADVMGAILRDEPRSLRESSASLPESLDRIVQRCMEKKPEERFQSARDLAFAIRNVMGSSVAAEPADTVASPRRASSFKWRNAAIIGWAAAVVLAGILATRERPTSVPPRISTLSYSGRDWGPAASPDGKLIAFVSDRDGISRIWFKQLATGSETPLTEGPDDYPRFSPDGSQVLFTRRGEEARDLYRVPVLGGGPRKILDNVQDADWSPDGRQVAFLRSSAAGEAAGIGLGIADAQSGKERMLANGGNRWWYAPRWSPDGKWIAVTTGPYTGSLEGRTSVLLIDPDSGETRDVNVPGYSGLYTSIEWSPGGSSFIVGRATELLSHTLGSPSVVFEYDLRSKTSRPLHWLVAREPRAGWGPTTYGVLGPDRLVMDEQVILAGLRLVDSSQFGRAGSEQSLTTGLGSDRQPTFHPGGDRILFSSNRNGNIDLWTVDVGTSVLRQITDDPADDWDPAYTPDGRHIVWSSSRGGHLEVWLSNDDGSGARQISSDGRNAENPTMTRDGEWIVYASNNDEHLGVWKVRPDGSDATFLAAGSVLLPEVSPDGKYALFLRVRSPGFSIEVLEVASGKIVPFQIDLPPGRRGENVVFGRARWTPDGTGILYIDQDRDGRIGVTRQDFAIGVDTAASRRPLAGFSSHYAAESLTISPDGKTIVISAMRARRSLKLVEELQLEGWE